MGVKDLWTVLTPYSTQKPLNELRGKKVAIDLAGWVCESLNVVDYAIHPRHHLKNLFFRTCYLLWVDVAPVFILEGEAPKLKCATIAKRNNLQFRGVRQREKGKKDVDEPKTDKGRTRFNQVLRQCESMLLTMGIHCLQAPGEAEAYCAFLNKHGLVDGVISQDSDCFAYGGIRVYRNFSISMQGTHAGQGGAVDIYDMSEICQKMDFGRQKVIAMALLCGCDYCPDGVDGVGRDSVMKLFNKHDNESILNRLRSWRREDDKYTALEMRVEDKAVCSNCGHLGRTQNHTKNGCAVCRTHRGCDESLWKEERISLKAELLIRKKALIDPNFPSEEIIEEFLTEPDQLPNANFQWRTPNLVKFTRKIGYLLQWPEIYCVQKFLPLVTRWQLINHKSTDLDGRKKVLEPQEILKKRVVKGIPSLEIRWRDVTGSFRGLIPQEQLDENKDEQELWTTIEPHILVEKAYPEMVAAFIKSKEKPPKKSAQVGKKKREKALSSLENLDQLIAVTDEIEKKVMRQPKKKAQKKVLPSIEKFLEPLKNDKLDSPVRNFTKGLSKQCSTPISSAADVYSDLDDECEDNLDMSAIVNAIVSRPKNNAAILSKLIGRPLRYESVPQDLSAILGVSPKCVITSTKDDLDLEMAQKRSLSITKSRNVVGSKKISLDDSFDVLIAKETAMRNSRIQADMDTIAGEDSFDKLVNMKNNRYRELFGNSPTITTHIDRFKSVHGCQPNSIDSNNKAEEKDGNQAMMPGENVSFFFDSGDHTQPDVFEQAMEESFVQTSLKKQVDDGDDVVDLISSDEES